MPDNLEKLIEEVGDVNIKKVLSAFKLENSLKTNVDKISAAQSKHLNSTIEYLATLENYPSAVRKLNNKKYNRVKTDAAFEITNFCYELTPAVCKKCTETYIPSDQHDSTTDSVCCIVCDKNAHNQCYTTELLDVESGIIFMCTECLKATNTSRMETIKLFGDIKIGDVKITEEKETGVPQVNQSHQNKKTAKHTYVPDDDFECSDGEEHETNIPKPQTKQNSNQDICKYYLLRTFRYGISGRGCKKDHPRQ